MKQLFIIVCLLNLVTLADKAIQVYSMEDNGVTHVTSDPSVSIYLVESKDFQGNRSPAIVSNR
jgi:hypothetical protein